MDHLDDQLTKIALNKKILSPVRAAASMGRKTCNRYYEKTDETEIYRFAMSKSLSHYVLPGLPANIHSLGSLPPPVQVRVFHGCRVDGRLD